jgi:hypothetical protein
VVKKHRIYDANSFMGSVSIIEKCKELDIELFYSIAFNKEVNPINKLIKLINEIENKASM